MLFPHASERICPASPHCASQWHIYLSMSPPRPLRPLLSPAWGSQEAAQGQFPHGHEVYPEGPALLPENQIAPHMPAQPLCTALLRAMSHLTISEMSPANQGAAAALASQCGATWDVYASHASEGLGWFCGLATSMDLGCASQGSIGTAGALGQACRQEGCREMPKYCDTLIDTFNRKWFILNYVLGWSWLEKPSGERISRVEMNKETHTTETHAITC